MNLLTILGQSLLFPIVFFPAVVPEVKDDCEGMQPVLLHAKSSEHFCPSLNNSIKFLQCQIYISLSTLEKAFNKLEQNLQVPIGKLAHTLIHVVPTSES